MTPEEQRRTFNPPADTIPLPEDSPFLSDHGFGIPVPPPAPRNPPVPPPDLSQFPPSVGSASNGSAVAYMPPFHPGPDPVRQSTAIPRASAGMLRPEIDGYSGSASQAIARGQAIPPVVVPPTVSMAALPSSNAVISPSETPTTAPSVVIQDSISSFGTLLGPDDPFASQPQLVRPNAVVQPIPQAQPQPELVAQLRAILVTSTDSLQGRLVEEYLGVVSSEVVVPMATLLMGSEPAGRFQRHKVAQSKLRQLKQLAVAELRLEAYKLQANGLLRCDLKLDIGEAFATIQAVGTAVRIS